jgi:hypothetical protein
MCIIKSSDKKLDHRVYSDYMNYVDQLDLQSVKLRLAFLLSN